MFVGFDKAYAQRYMLQLPNSASSKLTRRVTQGCETASRETEGKTNMRGSRLVTMFSLILAGEAIFGLPFAVARYFGPTFRTVFQVNDLELGLLFFNYGIIAVFAYLLGGPLADRFSPRKLLAFALCSTGVFGFQMATIPSLGTMKVLFAIWGVTTILPFWAALIRATRDWGGTDDQGKAFGILDGGRGLLAACLASAALGFFAMHPDDNPEDKRAALCTVIYMYTFVSLGAAVFIWFFVPDSNAPAEKRSADQKGETLRRIIALFKMPSIWLVTIVIICAYTAFKGTDFFSRYATDAYGLSEIEAAFVVTVSSWIRPPAAIIAGLLADRFFSSSRVILWSFVSLVGVFASFALTTPSASQAAVGILWANVTVSCVAVFALRGIYFALLEETSIPKNMTGMAVGVVSCLGYTPDIFVGVVGGWLLGLWPADKLIGYQVFFWLLAGMSLIGGLAAIGVRRRMPTGHDEISTQR
jgi:nitrate/nitrite transporter NarK